ncbi:MAG: helix-turn-helix domain-containing protein [Oscillospiraceae bacterium]|nr:helix-turn-helix domain-containing protein [Oscillospiraceae bacterium]
MNMLQTLDRLMKEKGLNRSRLAQKSGVPYTTIDGLYKKGFENVKLSTLLKLSRTLGVTLDELAGEEAPLGKERLDHEDLAVARDYHALDGHGKRLVRLVLDEEKSRLGTSAEEEPQEEIIQIKHYLVPAAAGYASPIEGEDYENIPLPHGAPANADFCLTIQGDSMEPYIHDGDLAFVKRDAPMKEFEPGIFFVDGDVLCKQWCIDYTGTLHLLSANPDREDANRSIPKNSGSTVVCFGKVLLDQRLPQPIYR